MVAVVIYTTIKINSMVVSNGHGSSSSSPSSPFPYCHHHPHRRHDRQHKGHEHDPGIQWNLYDGTPTVFFPDIPVSTSKV